MSKLSKLLNIGSEADVVNVDLDQDYTLDSIAIDETHQAVTNEVEVESSLLVSAEALALLQALPDSDFKTISTESVSLGLEVDGNTAAKIWAAIKTFFYRIGQAIKNFFAALFDTVKRVISELQHQAELLSKYHDNSFFKIESSLIKDLKYINTRHDSHPEQVDLGSSVLGLTDFKWQLDAMYKDHEVVVEGIESFKSEKEHEYYEQLMQSIEENIAKANYKKFVIGGWVLEVKDRQGKVHRGAFPTLTRLIFPFSGSYETRINVAIARRLVAEAIGVCKLLLSKKEAYANASKKVSEYIAQAKERDIEAKGSFGVGDRLGAWIHARTLYGKTNKNFVDMNRIGFHAARAVSSVCNSYFKVAKAHVELPDEPVPQKQSQLLLTN